MDKVVYLLWGWSATMDVFPTRFSFYIFQESHKAVMGGYSAEPADTVADSGCISAGWENYYTVDM